MAYQTPNSTQQWVMLTTLKCHIHTHVNIVPCFSAIKTENKEIIVGYMKELQNVILY